jgi:hypothetical protein
MPEEPDYHEIKQIHDFKIICKELIDCPSQLETSLKKYDIALLTAIPLTPIIFAYVYRDFSVVVIGAMISSMLLCGLFLYPNSLRKCGTEIILQHDYNIRTEYYQFTENPHADVTNINKIVSDLEQFAESEYQRISNEKERNANKIQKCSDTYQSLISKIK